MNVVIWNPLVGVGVDFDEPGAEVFVNQEVVAEQLKAVPSLLGIQRLLRCQNGVNDHVFHSGHQVFLNRNSILAKVLIEVFLKGLESQSVPVFVFSVVVPKFLETVVSQVNVVVFVR